MTIKIEAVKAEIGRRQDGSPVLPPSVIAQADSERSAAFCNSRYFSVIGRVEQALTIPILVLLLPLFLVVACLIRFKTGFDVLYTQMRYGRDSRFFKIYKFTTMPPEVPVVPSDMLGPYEAKIPPFGKFLRKSRLNELPQFYNVLKGEMRWVGPRPLAAVDDDIQQCRMEMGLDLLKPGITFTDRIYLDGNLTLEQRMTKEREYISNKGSKLLMDLKIIAKTIYVLLMRKLK